MTYLPKPDAILFDWDNTLVDTFDDICAAIKYTLAHYKLGEISDEDCLYFTHASSKGFIYKYFPNEDDHVEARKFFLDAYANISEGNVSLLPDATKTLEHIYNLQIKMAVVSNKISHCLRKEIQELRVLKYFLSIVGSGDVEEDKPSPLPALKALKAIDINPSNNVWFVGDSATDMKTAHRSGCLPILFGHDDQNADYYKDNMPTLYFPNHKELLQYCKNIK